jgi:hypothetical protein
MLIGAQLTFLIGIDRTTPNLACHVSALFLYYFLLASFMWMLIDGWILYRTFVVVFTDGKIKWRKLYFIGYVVPLMTTAIAAGIRWQNFGSSANCWLSTAHGTIWSFIAPMVSVIAVNVVVFALVLRQVIHLSRRIRRRSSSMQDVGRLTSLKKGLRASFSFLSLLGLTWVFGALAIGDASLAFYYLFAICNSLQGFFIFVGHCYMDVGFVFIVS